LPTKNVEVIKKGEIVKLDEFSQIQIKPRSDKKGMEYIVIEPELTENAKKMFKEIKTVLTEKIEYDYEATKKTKDPREYIETKLKEVVKEKNIKKKLVGVRFKKIKYYLIRDFLGFGIIDAIMKDPDIEDVYCNGVNESIFVRHKTYGSLRTNLIFKDMKDLEKFIMILSQKCKRFVTYAEPLLDSTLPDGSRLQATFGQDVTLKGPTFSIRKFQKLPITPIELIKFGTVSSAMMAYFWLAIENNVSALIAGGSGTGKTSFLNAICMFIPPDYKIISIEDTSELNLPNKNWVKSITRTGYGPKTSGEQRYGEVTMFDLLKASLRQRPDYVIIGEVRGPEASVLFQGMASGHPSIGTIHAESLEAVIERLTTPPINLPPNLVELIDVVVLHIFAKAKGPNARRVSKVIEIRDVTHGKPDVMTPFLWDPFSDSFVPIESFIGEKSDWRAESLLIDKLSAMTGKPKDKLAKELKQREKIIKWMVKNDVKSFFEVFNMVADYWYAPQTVLDKIKRPLTKKPRARKKRKKKKKVKRARLKIIRKRKRKKIVKKIRRKRKKKRKKIVKKIKRKRK